MKQHLALIFSISLLYFLACKRNSLPKNPTDNSPTPSEFALSVVLDSLAHPWSMAFLAENEVLVAEKDGILKRILLDSKQVFPVAGLPTDRFQSIRQEDPRDNSGLFEVLLDPNFLENRWVYLSYTAEDETGMGTKVIRAKLNQDRLEKIQTLLEAKPFRKDLFHYGGGMTFGNDGKLYITCGERFYNEIDQPDLPVAQDLSDMRGKIYRINPDGTIPADNPNFGSNAIPGCFALGIRAAQGITRRPETNEIWFSEHGSRQGDEINFLQAGANYGWPIETTGTYRNETYQAPQLPKEDFFSPRFSWEQTVAPTGLCFYIGKEFTEWTGDLLVAGLSRGSLWKITFEDDRPLGAENLMKENPIRLRKVVQSPGAKLYILTDEKNGKLIQLIPA
ncbi:MAG: PQQ-dependent sugar dehydrogenase [Bacteroidota bacterium]